MKFYSLTIVMFLFFQEELPNLRDFSLECYSSMYSYEKSILPLLQRMICLEKLSLNIMCDRGTSFIDGMDLKKIINHFTMLNQFTFHIRSTIFCDLAPEWPSNEQIQDTFMNLKQYHISSSVDYFLQKRIGQCHIYSNPYTMNWFHNIANHFPGGLFKSVRKISLFDEHPFEYEFFIKIAQAFPLIKELSLSNRKAQKDKNYRNSKDNSEDLPLIKYLHLTKLDLISAHQDYINLFLDHTITSLPNCISLGINYISLTRVTHHFTNDRLSINCGKVIRLRIYSKCEISEDLKGYFPHVKQIGCF